MANSRFLLRPILLSKLFQRTFATEVAASPVPPFIYNNPVDLDRADTARELVEKANKPWTELSKDDKIAIYRASYPHTIEQMIDEGSDTKKIIGGVSALLALSVIAFMFFRQFVSATPPRSLNEEWEKATVERHKRRRANPITGISSQ